MNGIAGWGTVQVGTWHQRSCLFGNLHRENIENQIVFVKVFHNVCRVVMSTQWRSPCRHGCFSTCRIWRWADDIICIYFSCTSPWRPARVYLLWEGSSIVMSSWNQDLNHFCYNGRNGSNVAALLLAVSEGNHVCVFCAIFQFMVGRIACWPSRSSVFIMCKLCGREPCRTAEEPHWFYSSHYSV